MSPDAQRPDKPAGAPISRIFLVGSMASGKTTVGRALARMLSWRFIDLDECIEARVGKSISAIFNDSGEAAFRRLESECLRELMSQEGLVVATGGGAMEDAANRELIRGDSHSHCVHLSAQLPTLLARLDDRARSLRPLLSAEDWRERLKSLLAKRGGHWRECADSLISTDGKDPASIGAQLLARLLPMIIGAGGR